MEHRGEPAQPRMSNASFRLMTWLFGVIDLFVDPAKVVRSLGISPGQVVVDYGCGPGRQVRVASTLVGATGKVYAIDVHPLALQTVRAVIDAHRLCNVSPVLADRLPTAVPSQSAHLVYALDMIHMVSDKASFFREARRIVRPDGALVIDDGHQARTQTLQDVRESRLWQVQQETTAFLRCAPDHER